MTPPPDLLPWNATGCCAGNKKRQRLKPQGATLPGPGESSTTAARRKQNMFSGFPYAHGRGVWGISHITTPLPPSLCPYLHGPCPMNSRTAASPEGGSPCYPRLSLSSSLVPHTIARYRKMANSTFHIISGELLSTSCPALVLLVFRGRKTGGCSIVLLVFSSQVI